MTYQTIRLAIADAVATITLNRPDRLNAAPPLMAEEVTAALATLRGAGARALVLTGEGRAFCSGADLAAGGPTGMNGAASRAWLEESYNPMMLALAELGLPVICAVNGPAAGIGCSIALAGDFVIAGRSAYFLHAFVNIGLVSDGGATWSLPRMIGKARATAMMLLGERVTSDKALAWGLIHKVVEDDALIAEAGALGARLAAGPTVAIGLMRREIWRAQDRSYAETLQSEAENQEIAGDSADAREGAIAFLTKRKAEFSGT